MRETKDTGRGQDHAVSYLGAIDGVRITASAAMGLRRLRGLCAEILTSVYDAQIGAGKACKSPKAPMEVEYDTVP